MELRWNSFLLRQYYAAIANIIHVIFIVYLPSSVYNKWVVTIVTYTGGSSFFIRQSWVNQVWPPLRRFMTTSSLLVSELLGQKLTWLLISFNLVSFPLILPCIAYFSFGLSFDVCQIKCILQVGPFIEVMAFLVSSLYLCITLYRHVFVILKYIC